MRESRFAALRLPALEVAVMRGLVFGLLLPVMAGCGGSPVPDLPAGTTVSYADHLEELVLLRCLSCHTADAAKGELILERGDGYGQLVDRRSVQEPDLPLVAPGDPTASYLWQKLEHTASQGKGMPRTLFGAKRLPQRELDLFRLWIETGANP